VAKKFQHADKRSIPFAVIIGEDEIASDNFVLKNLVTGEQLSLILKVKKSSLENYN
jgi:histidyl-tRNA synthetase